jgi:hypothetical protein
VSFAELPESYASSKPEGFSIQFKAKKEKRRKKGKEKAARKKEDEDQDEHTSGWWTNWLSGSGTSGARQEERAEERAARWGMRLSGPGFGSGVDDWTF